MFVFFGNVATRTALGGAGMGIRCRGLAGFDSFVVFVPLAMRVRAVGGWPPCMISSSSEVKMATSYSGVSTLARVAS